MNDITAVFLCELAAESGRAELFQLLQQDLCRWLDACCPVRTGGVRAVSPQAVQLHTALQQLHDRAGQIDTREKRQWFREQMNQYTSKWNQLRGQTSQAVLHSWVPPLEALHFLTQKELVRETAAIRQQVQIQLYRLLMLGGASAVQGMEPPPADSTAERLLDFYWSALLPRLQRLTLQQLQQEWAVELRDETRFGTSLQLPTYLLRQPMKLQSSTAPGHYQSMSRTGGVWYQGRGLLTNIRPAEIGRALREGFVSGCCVADLDRAELLDADPRHVLEEVFPGRFYALDPYSYFSVASYALNSRVTAQRLARGRCLLCGTSTLKEGSRLCRNCFSNLAQKSQ